MKHTFEVHTNCNAPHCMICDGGLQCCTTCHGAEGELPTDCPGVEMTDEQKRAVYRGKLDFVGESWIEKPRDSHAWCPNCKAPPAAPCYAWCKK